MKVRPTWSYRCFSAVTMALFAILVIAPVALVMAHALSHEGRPSPASLATVLSGQRQWRLLANSVSIAAGTAVVATLIGAPTAFALERCRPGFKKPMLCALAAPLLIPPYVFATAWIDVLDRARLFSAPLMAENPLPSVFSIPGAILLGAVSSYPLVVFSTVITLRRFDPRIEEAARLVVTRKGAFLSVTMPLLAPGILTGSLFAFVLSLVAFSVPSLLQVNVYTVEIYSTLSAFHDYPMAAAQALPLIACGAVALTAWFAFLRPRQAWLKNVGKDRAAATPRVRLLCVTFCVCVLLITTCLPLAALAVRAMPLTSFQEAWATANEEIATSLALSALTATLLTSLAFAMAWLTSRRAAGSWVYGAAIAAFLVTGPLLGVGMIALWNRRGVGPVVFDTVLVLVFACAAKFLFFGYQGILISLRQLHPCIIEAAETSGIPWYRQLSGIAAPLTSPTLLAVWGMAFILSFGEIDASVMVSPPGMTPLSIRVFSLMHYGPSRLVAALCLITAALMLPAYLLTTVAFHAARKKTNATG